MNKLPQDELRDLLSIHSGPDGIDQQAVKRFQKKLADEFRKQLVWGFPTNDDEAGLRKLAKHLREKKVIVKLCVRHSLHAKLYLLFRKDPVNPIVGYLGSSNLTFPGLSSQGELNIDVLDGDGEAEVDLASYAFQIWKNAIDIQPELQKIIPGLPDVAYSTRAHKPTADKPDGVLVYLKTGEGNDALAYVDSKGNSITESQYEILKIAACGKTTAAEPRNSRHHYLVKAGIAHIITEETRVGGQLGRPSGARFRSYERLKSYSNSIKGTLFESPELLKAIDEIYRYPLRPTATDRLNRQLRSGISDI